ncbi:SDR family oxidoreductase [Chitiniphilus purpureus]|uniref:SDR family oxidoreductase n=1 Tax=Chitiniphilus purpureus TaxID=2981137 RepID=A0ABY6DJG3_9NEIS|nr:SDR family oxidoreductase [Chitiniphilus sp. CD1]UXY14472.1 SDR family oxidoreductase [Chitiniphilus sp. CD1]
MTQALVTGASGFVGRALLAHLAGEAAFQPLAAVRRPPAQVVTGVRYLQAGDLSGPIDWAPLLAGIDVVVHAAARVHVMQDTAADPLQAFRQANVEGTLHLARQAAAAGVRRFVFISSIKVNGEGTLPGRAYTADDTPAPVDAYGLSKLEAEQGLLARAGQGGMEVVIIRPPLVYGPGVKANFLQMMRWLHRRVPLPLGAIGNRRSLVGMDNLCDLIRVCMTHPAAGGQVFLASDGCDLSTTALLRQLGEALGRPARLWPVPAHLLEIAAACVGRRAVARRLLGSLQVDIAKTRQLLDWHPPVTVEHGLAMTAESFLKQVAK